MGCKQVVCWDVLRVLVDGLKEVTGLVVVDVDVKIMILGVDWSVAGCKVFREVKGIIN